MTSIPQHCSCCCAGSCLGHALFSTCSTVFALVATYHWVLWLSYLCRCAREKQRLMLRRVRGDWPSQWRVAWLLPNTNERRGPQTSHIAGVSQYAIHKQEVLSAA